MSESLKENKQQTPAQEGLGPEQEGLQMKAPAFQLMASPSNPPIQRQVPPVTPPVTPPPAGPPTQTGGARREDRRHTERSGLLDPFSGNHPNLHVPVHRDALEEDIVNPQHRWDGTDLGPTFNDHLTVEETAYGRYDTSFTASTVVGGETFSIQAHSIEGTSNERAMIVGGIHGTEGGSVEVAERLLASLRDGSTPRPYYNLLLITQLMPHNYAHDDRETVVDPAGRGAMPRRDGQDLPSTYRRHLDRDRERTENGVTRTIHDTTLTDPNRQAPTLGSGLDHSNPVDARGRQIEPELQILISLFDRYHPSRIVMLHGIRNEDEGGIYADPRTDAAGVALGYAPDEDLTLRMARNAESTFDATRHGNDRSLNVVPGNGRTRNADGRTWTQTPRIQNAIYPGENDPAAVPAGDVQPRTDNNGRSFGSYFSTAVADPARPDQNRPAVTTLTLETPGYGRSDALSGTAAEARRAQIDALMGSLRDVFLGPDPAPVPPSPAPAPPTAP